MQTTEARLTDYADRAFPHYVECALWSSMDQSDGSGGKPMDDTYAYEDIARASRKAMREELGQFVREAGELLDDITPEMAGHDFWLTRNRHGAGFWDRGLGATGERLSDMAHAYGPSDLYVGDDGRVYVS